MEHDATVHDHRYLAIYLRDHFAGASAGLSLVKRSRAANLGTPWEPLLTELESEISADRCALEEMMRGFGVAPSTVKSVLGSVAELVGRAKTNGHLATYSPLSRLMELELLAAGVLTKRNLWRSLREVVHDHDQLRTDELDELIRGATSQLERILDGHRMAAVAALASSARESTAA
jgi:hypothetical protein